MKTKLTKIGARKLIRSLNRHRELVMNQPSRIVYVNGAFVEEQAAMISVRDKGFVYGDSVFDTARTFNGKLFRLEQHIDRLLNSLATAMIDPGISAAQWIELTRELVKRNLPALRPGEDYWVSQRVTSGLMPLDGEDPVQSGCSVIIDCVPIPLRARAHYFSEGIVTRLAGRKRIAPSALSPNVKTNNYLNMLLAQREVQMVNPGAWALMCDENGNIAEGAGCNFFVVRDGVVQTPRVEYVLDGVSRQVVLELCHKLNIPCRETDFDLSDALAADEAFFTSTSLCMCPVRWLDDKEFVGIPGPVSQLLMDGFKKIVGMDYVAQYLEFQGSGVTGTGI